MPAAATRLFLNPAAGRGRAGKRLPRIVDILREAGHAVDVTLSSAVGDLEDQVAAATAAGLARVIVAGGDGSIHEAVNGMRRGNEKSMLGVIPTGTGNDFAKACDITLDWEAATRLLANRLGDGRPLLHVDLGRCNDRYFANGAGIGFDAKVTAIARSVRWPIGDLVYLVAIFRGMHDGIITPELDIRGDDVHLQGPVTLANFANGPWVGGMFEIAPMASNRDGAFDLVVADPVSGPRILSLLPKLIRGTHAAAPEFRHIAGRRFEVHAAEPVPSHLDGEVVAPRTDFEIELLPGALRLI